MRVAVCTGLRLGELRALRWRDVDFANATIHVRRNAPTSAPAGSKVKAPKSRHSRSVPLIDVAATVLDRAEPVGDDHEVAVAAGVEPREGDHATPRCAASDGGRREVQARVPPAGDPPEACR